VTFFHAQRCCCIQSPPQFGCWYEMDELAPVHDIMAKAIGVAALKMVALASRRLSRRRLRRPVLARIAVKHRVRFRGELAARQRYNPGIVRNW
jgi:hypothetical protein